jgi:hypothetical protein
MRGYARRLGGGYQARGSCTTQLLATGTIYRRLYVWRTGLHSAYRQRPLEQSQRSVAVEEAI